MQYTDQPEKTGQTQSSVRQLKTPNCHVCCDLDPDKSVKRFSLFTKTSLTELDVTASAGCPACAMLRDGIKRSDLWTKTSKFAMYITGSQQLVLKLASTSRTRGRPSQSYSLEFYTCEGAPRPWPAIGLGREVSSDASSEECMKWAVRWLTDCTEHHVDCQRPGPTPLPIRVVSVGSDSTQPFLYTSGGEGRYAALSHCWGRAQPPLQTHMDTLKPRTAGIPFEDLPRTFRDAVIITRRLGLKYLWIDSLCIIQDSPRDWENESAKMATIYQNAYVTIAADAASNSREGCFYTRNHRSDLQLRCTVPDGRESMVRVRSYFQERSRPDGLAHNCTNHALGMRAWTLQERILAPRILHYTAAELVWECATQISCECQVQPDGADQSSLRHWLTDNTLCFDNGKNSFDPRRFLDGWENIVENFTRRRITRTTDRLPALSGIAAAIQKITSATYICGLWHQRIEFGLLWHTPRSYLEVSERQDEKYAPSWSWASITGPVSYTAAVRSMMVISSYFKILEVKSRLAGANPYGPVEDGSIKLQGVLCGVRLEHGETSDSEELRMVSIEDPSLHSDIFYPDIKGKDGYEVSVEDCYSFLIVVCDRADDPGAAGLVLRRSVKRPEAYTRVGFMFADERVGYWYAVGHRQSIVII